MNAVACAQLTFQMLTLQTKILWWVRAAEVPRVSFVSSYWNRALYFISQFRFMSKDWEYTSMNLLRSKNNLGGYLCQTGNYQPLCFFRVAVSEAIQFVWSDVKIVCVNCIMACANTYVFTHRMSKRVCLWYARLKDIMKYAHRLFCVVWPVSHHPSSCYHLPMMASRDWNNCMMIVFVKLPWKGWVKPTIIKTKRNQARTASIAEIYWLYLWLKINLLSTNMRNVVCLNLIMS